MKTSIDNTDGNGSVCRDCGRKIKDGDYASIWIDPKSEWWLHLTAIPPVCKDCSAKRRKQIAERDDK